MMEIAGFVQPDFIVNTVPNLDGQIAGVFAGNWVSAWMDSVKLVNEIFGVAIEEEADIVIATAGGYPKDINLYQTGKTMDNAYYAMKKGGVAIILSECPEITEPREFFQWFEYPSISGNGKGSAGEFLHCRMGRPQRNGMQQQGPVPSLNQAGEFRFDQEYEIYPGVRHRRSSKY